MNNVESISNDVKRNIDINNSRANILVDELTLAQSELMSLQIKLNWIKTLMRTNPSSKVLAEVVAIL